MSSSVPTTGKRSGHPAGFVVLVGILFIIVGIVVLMAQVETNEAFITNAGQVASYRPDWAILWQIPNLIIGHPSASEAAATVFGWSVELIYLGSIVGFEVMHHAAKRSGEWMAKVFLSMALLIILFNMWTDYNYGSLGGGQWGHFLFALVASFVVGFFFSIGMRFIEHGWQRA